MVAHEDHLVDLVDSHGQIVSQKPRKNIDKATDLYHGVYVLLVTPDKKLVLSVIPRREDLPNMHSGKLGVTAATIRRRGEDSKAAARRVLQKEVGIELSELVHLGDVYTETLDSAPRYISAYSVVHEMPRDYNRQDIERLEAMGSDELEHRIDHEPQLLAPTLRLIWSEYNPRLPVR